MNVGHGLALGIVADDFTGAADVAGTLTRRGARTALAFNRCPDDIGDGFDACVVGLKTRSVPAADAVRQSREALAGLQALQAARFLFKYCSTFDSTPAGNIGPVTEAFIDALGVAGPVVCCPAFPETGRTVYQGHLFVHDRLLSESGMEKHPLNPMTDPDIRRWLKRQTVRGVGHLPLAAVREGVAAIAARLGSEADAGRPLVIADATSLADLAAIGAAIADHRLAGGASGIAGAMIGDVGKRARRPWRGIAGPGLVLAGSTSEATRRQTAEFARAHPVLTVDPERVLEGSAALDEAVAFVKGHRHESPLVHTVQEPGAVHEVQVRHGVAVVAEALDAFFGELAAEALAAGVTRLVVAGGETSGAVVSRLAVPLLEVGPEIAPGVPALKALDRGLAIALKSGNFGDTAFFEKALARLGAVE